jgi:hypothetical protein
VCGGSRSDVSEIRRQGIICWKNGIANSSRRTASSLTPTSSHFGPVKNFDRQKVDCNVQAHEQIRSPGKIAFLASAVSILLRSGAAWPTARESKLSQQELLPGRHPGRSPATSRLIARPFSAARCCYLQLTLSFSDVKIRVVPELSNGCVCQCPVFRFIGAFASTDIQHPRSGPPNAKTGWP